MTDPRRGQQAALPAPGHGGPVVDVPYPAAPVRILVVGADPATLDAVHRAFPDGEVEPVAALADVVARLVGRGPGHAPARPDLALVDLDLPGVDGVEVARLLAASTGATVLVTTRASDPERVLDALEAGAHDFLAHPADAGELRLRARAVHTGSGRAAGAMPPAPPAPTALEVSPERDVSPSELLHELNNVLGAMRFTVFLSRPRPVPPEGHHRDSAPLEAGEAADRIDGLVGRASALVVELARRLAAQR